MSFDAQQSDDDRMKFSFKPFVDIEGFIEEPTMDQIEDFYSDWRAVSLEAVEYAEGLLPKDREGKRREETAKQTRERELAQRGQGREINKTLNRRRAEIMAALCSNFPDADTIEKLPGRIRIKFQDYLFGELTPEG